MIFGNIENFQEIEDVFSDKIKRGLEYIKDTDFTKVPPGRYDIDGDELFVLVSEYRTSPRSEKRPEAHIRYIDIQYIVYGEETIGYAIADTQNNVYEDLRESKDIIFYASVKNEVGLILTKGTYAVFFPTDIHCPGCNAQESVDVKKVVIKVKI